MSLPMEVLSGCGGWGGGGAAGSCLRKSLQQGSTPLTRLLPEPFLMVLGHLCAIGTRLSELSEDPEGTG